VTRSASFRQADLKRALAVLESRGLAAASIILQPNGSVEITPKALTAESIEPSATSLDAFRERKRAGRSA
jgi:hypothetical protein